MKRPIRHKFGAVRCQQDDIKFPSMLERNVYRALKDLQAQEKIRFFLRQIRFDLPGGYKHYVDYAVFTDCEVLFVEAKGRDLGLGKLKREQSSELYQVPIYLVKKPEDIVKLVLEHTKIPGEGRMLC